MTANAPRRRIIAVFTAAMMLTTLGYTAAFATDGGQSEAEFTISADCDGVTVSSSKEISHYTVEDQAKVDDYDSETLFVSWDDLDGATTIQVKSGTSDVEGLAIPARPAGCDESQVSPEPADQILTPGHCPDGYEKIDYSDGNTWTADADYDSVILVGGDPNSGNRDQKTDGVEKDDVLAHPYYDISHICVKGMTTSADPSVGSHELDLTPVKVWTGDTHGNASATFGAVTGTFKSYEAPAFQFGPNGWDGYSCGSGEIIVGASWTTEGEAIAYTGLADPADGYGATEYGFVLQNGAVAQEVVLTINCLVIASIDVDETVTGLADNCSYTSAITKVSLYEGQVLMEVTNTVDCVDVQTPTQTDDVDVLGTTVTTMPIEVLGTTVTTMPAQVLGTTVTTMPAQVLGITVSEVSADTLPFTGFAAGGVALLAMLALLAGGTTLFAVRGKKEEEGAVTDIGGWSNL